MLTEEILDQLDSNILELELDITNPLDHSNMDNPPPMEMEGVEEQGEKEKGKKRKEKVD